MVIKYNQFKPILRKIVGVYPDRKNGVAHVKAGPACAGPACFFTINLIAAYARGQCVKAIFNSH